MTRREWLWSVPASLAVTRSTMRGGEVPSSYYRDYSRCLPDYLATLARSAYQRRERDLARLTSAGAIRKRQQWVSETFWTLIGGQPERTPLNARVTGSFEREGYRVEKVVFESRPRVFVTSNLYVPTTGKPPYAGILFSMGHALEGKAYPSYQKCCQGLARLGFIVLAFDPVGQGERISYPDSTGVTTRLESADDEHTLPGKQLLLLGRTMSQMQVWDAIRGLDYLAAHPMVDPQRLGATGQSGGATVTMFLGAADPRVSAAVVSSGNTENVASAHFNAPGSTDDAEQDLIHSGPLGFDRWDLLYPLAPKPLLVLVSEHDFYGTYSPQYLIDGREQYQKLAQVYDVLGHRDHLEWGDTPLPHGLSYSLRLQTYNWFSRWLNHSNRRIEQEPPVMPEPLKTLSTGPFGNVVRDYGSSRPIDHIRDRAKQIQPDGTAMRFQFPSKGIRFARLAQTPADGLKIEAIEVRSAPQVWIPAWLFVPAKPDPGRPVLLVLDDNGRNAGAGEDGLYAGVARSGGITCAADLRGMGDSRPEVGPGNPVYTIPHHSEEDYAWSSLILGKSLLCQRVEDILALVQALKNDSGFGSRKLVLAAKGRLTLPALFAFATSPSIDSLYLAGGLVSYKNLLETEDYRQPLASLEWDIYRKTDLPLLAAQAAPRPVHLAGTTNAPGVAMNADLVRSIYASSNVQISTEPAWDAKMFASL